jgi:hypothetical protein
MQGVAGMTTNLRNEIISTIGALPATLTSATGAGADTALSDVMTTLTTSADSTLASLGNDLALLTQSQQVQILNQLAGSLVSPALADISNVVGTYNAWPMLTANAAGASAGTYEGTMTITMVQQ